jgi:hypothetical protein
MRCAQCGQEREGYNSSLNNGLGLEFRNRTHEFHNGTQRAQVEVTELETRRFRSR